MGRPDAEAEEEEEVEEVATLPFLPPVLELRAPCALAIGEVSTGTGI